VQAVWYLFRRRGNKVSKHQKKFKMKKNLLLIFLVALLFSCKKDSGSPTSGNPSNDGTPPGIVIATARIMEGTVPGDKANGDAKVYNDNGKWRLFLTNFTTNNGPDLHVYLATSQSAGTFIDLGTLKAVSGNQTYDISGNPSLSNYKYVIIWCKQFGVYFGGGELK
jgi:Electron transfer DM13